MPDHGVRPPRMSQHDALRRAREKWNTKQRHQYEENPPSLAEWVLGALCVGALLGYVFARYLVG